MRKLQERFVQSLLRILNEYEAWLRSKEKMTLQDHIRINEIIQIKQQISKRYGNRLRQRNRTTK